MEKVGCGRAYACPPLPLPCPGGGAPVQRAHRGGVQPAVSGLLECGRLPSRVLESGVNATDSKMIIIYILLALLIKNFKIKTVH